MTATGTTVVVRYYAGARAAVGVSQERVMLNPGATVADVLDALTGRHGPRLERVLPASSFLLDGVAVRDRSVSVRDGAGLDVLPPFAGG